MTDSEPTAAQPEPAADNAAREAGRYRNRLREAEAQRDKLSGQLAALQRVQADAAISRLGMTPTAVWAAGTNLDDVLDDDGNVDPDRVAAAARQAAENLGLTPQPRPPGIAGLHSGTMKQPDPEDTWTAAFSNRNP